LGSKRESHHNYTTRFVRKPFAGEKFPSKDEKPCGKPSNSKESHVAPIFKILNLPLLWLKMCLIGSQEAQKVIFSKSHFAPKMAQAAI
jgi:hypothetical protein